MMRGRSPRCKFNPAWLKNSSVLTWSPELVKKRLTENKTKTKEYYNTHNKVTNICIKVGDWVTIKKPTKVAKGVSRFYDPTKVIEVVNNAVRLENGKVWNLKRVVLCKKSKNEGKSITDLVTDPLWSTDINIPLHEEIVVQGVSSDVNKESGNVTDGKCERKRNLP